MDTPFYKNGLKFECQRCSACCRHDPGYVYLSALDFIRLRSFLGLDFAEFFNKFIRMVDVGSGYAVSLKEKSNYDCIMWSPNGCSVYEARPVQCSTYPFWNSIIESAGSWAMEALECPGINKGELISQKTILEKVNKRRNDSLLIVSYDVNLESLDEDTLLGRERILANTPDPFETAQ